ncbi:MAG TPA: energy-coupled thiamine transporter ThiT [Candidatus Bathyarchaeia archaeon]
MPAEGTKAETKPKQDSTRITPAKIVPTRILAEGAVLVALSGALHLVTFYQAPLGGRVTAGAMIPVLLFALRRGYVLGTVAGAVYGLIVLFEEPFLFHPVQVLLDYFIAFGILGVAGFFRKIPLVGILVALAGRFASHFASGVIFAEIFIPAGADPFVYSAIYNGQYLIPELVISAIIVQALVRLKALELYL